MTRKGETWGRDKKKERRKADVGIGGGGQEMGRG